MSKNNPGQALSDRPAHLTIADAFQITEKQAEFLTNFGFKGNLTRAAEAVNPDNPESARRYHYECLEYSAGYREAYEHVKKAVGNRVIEKMAERATEGDVVLHGGEIVTDEDGNPLRKYDTVLQIFLAKSLAKLSDQPQVARGERSSGPTVIIHLPEPGGTSQPIIYHPNTAEVEDTDKQSVGNPDE